MFRQQNMRWKTYSNSYNKEFAHFPKYDISPKDLLGHHLFRDYNHMSFLPLGGREGQLIQQRHQRPEYSKKLIKAVEI